MRHRLALALALVLTARAHAGNGASPIANSPAANGRGGAEIAVLDDAHGVAVNPAGTALLGGPRIDLGVGFYLTRSRYANARNGDESELGFPFPAPALAFAMPIPLGDGGGDALGFGVALHPIAGGNSKATFRTAAYPGGETESSKLQIFGLTAGFAVKVIPRVSLGVGVTGIYASLDQSGIVGGGGQSAGLVRNFENGSLNAADPLFRVNGQTVTWGRLLENVRAPDTFGTSRIEVEGATGFGASGTFGAVVEATDWLSLGMSYRTPGFLSDLRGEAFLDATASASAGSAALDQIQASFLANHLPDQGRLLASRYDIRLRGLRVPQQVGAGVALWPHERVLFALDLKWIGWRSAFDEVTILLERGQSRDLAEITTNQSSPVIRSKVPYRWKDRVVVACGVAVSPFEWLVLRAGYNWGSNPVPSKTENPFVSATVEHHLALGIGLRFGPVSVDLAWVRALPNATRIGRSVANQEWNGMRHEADQDAFLLGGGVRF